MYAYLVFGGPQCNQPNLPRTFMYAPAKEVSPPRSGQTVSGYGSKLPTPYMVLLHGRWRRVYAACYGNASSYYIGNPGEWLATVDIENGGE